MKLKARYVERETNGYRWLATIGSGALLHAQAHPAARASEDNWVSDQTIGRTIVDVPGGLLVLDSETKKKGGHSYTAGVTTETVIDWSRATWIETKKVADPTDRSKSPRKLTVHVIDVDGVRGEYVEGGQERPSLDIAIDACWSALARLPAADAEAVIQALQARLRSAC